MSDDGFAAFANLPLISNKDLFSEEIFDTKDMNEEEKEKVKEFSAQYKILMEYGNYEEALDHIENFHNKHPDDGRRFILISFVYSMLGRNDEALKNCEAAIASDTTNVNTRQLAYMQKSHILYEKFQEKMDDFTSSWKANNNEIDDKDEELMKIFEHCREIHKNSLENIEMAEKLGTNPAVLYLKSQILLYVMNQDGINGAMECINQAISICHDDGDKITFLRMKAAIHALLADSKAYGKDLNEESRLEHNEERDRCMEKVKELEKSGAKPYVVGSKARNKEKQNE